MDIGPGDTVEAVRDNTLGPYSIVGGHGYVVAELRQERSWGQRCQLCGQTDPISVILVGMPEAHWCTSSFRKRPPGRDAWIRELEKPVEVSEPVDLRELVP